MPRRVEVLDSESRPLSPHESRARVLLERPGVEGRGEQLGILSRQDVPGLQVEHARSLSLDRGAHEHRLVHGERESGTLDQAREPIVVAHLGCPGLFAETLDTVSKFNMPVPHSPLFVVRFALHAKRAQHVVTVVARPRQGERLRR